jgi:hypothetical protein
MKINQNYKKDLKWYDHTSYYYLANVKTKKILKMLDYWIDNEEDILNKYNNDIRMKSTILVLKDLKQQLLQEDPDKQDKNEYNLRYLKDTIVNTINNVNDIMQDIQGTYDYSTIEPTIGGLQDFYEEEEWQDCPKH